VGIEVADGAGDTGAGAKAGAVVIAAAILYVIGSLNRAVLSLNENMWIVCGLQSHKSMFRVWVRVNT
jgi:hypothetical protein